MNRTGLFKGFFSIIFSFILILFGCLTGLPVRAEEDSCSQGRHQDIIVSEKPATRTDNGKIVYVCENCDRRYTDILYPTTHRWSDWNIIQEATCTTSGLRSRICSVGGTHAEQEFIPAFGHNYRKSVTHTTCTEDGIITFTCTECGDTYEEKSEAEKASGHQYLSAVHQEADCTENGLMLYTCKVCNDSYSEVIPALGHQFGDWTEEQPQYTSRDLVKVRVCTVCGFSQTGDAGLIPVFNQIDILIASANTVIILLFVLFIFSDIQVLIWNKKRREQWMKQRQKQLEEQQYDFH